MFSVIIPTINNLNYLKICLESLKRNSSLKNEIIIHVNCGSDGSLEFVKKNKYLYTHSKNKLGLCRSVNTAFKKSSLNYIVYAHDDMYFLPAWDVIMKKEILKIKNNLFFISGIMMGPSDLIDFDCGRTFESFNEQKLLNNYKKYNLYDFQGSYWAPHVIHRDTWNKVSGLSEEFDPGFGSDPDLNFKLWKLGVRYFKGLNDCKVYHFGSISLRKKKDLIANKGNRIFLKKWGITINFFKRYYLKYMTVFNGPLSEPKKNINFYIGFIICKIKYLFLFFQK
jgi:glycosyltransferase involved in cell wall biosynthesis